MAVARFADLPEVLTVTETAKLLRLGRNSVYDAVRRRELPAVRIGRRLLIPKLALQRFLEEQVDGDR